MEFEVSLRLDSEGFLRRGCPSCNREFKWLPSDDSEPAPDSRYGCPYCKARYDADSFFTDDQNAYITGVAGQGAMAELAAAGWEIDSEPAPPQPDEIEDMVRVDFACHPSEPVKVFEEWPVAQPTHCLICGEPR